MINLCLPRDIYSITVKLRNTLINLRFVRLKDQRIDDGGDGIKLG